MRSNLVFRTAIALMLIITTTYLLQAQDNTNQSDTYLFIQLKNKETLTGKKRSTTDTHFIIETEKGKLVEVAHNDIKRFDVIDSTQIKGSKYWFENPNASRNIYGPTGYGLKKGEAYYQNFMLLVNHVGYGVTDNFTIGASIIPIPFKESLDFSITPKVSFPIVKNKVNVGLGVSYNRFWRENLGIAYGVVTLGSKDRNITLGGGYGMVNGEFSKRPILTVSGNFRLARKIGFVTENWFIPIKKYELSDTNNTVTYGYEGGVTFGIRYINEGVSVDLAILRPLTEDSFSFPIVGITLPFGKR